MIGIFFMYHWADAALVFAAPPKGEPATIPTRVLRENGWIADDANFRSALPRADASRIARLR
jgi:hypothetical protein